MTEVAQLQSTFHLLGEAVPQREPPPQLLQKIRAAASDSFVALPAVAANSSASLNGFRPAKAATTGRWKWAAGLGGAIAAAVIAALGIRVATLQAQLQQSKAKIQTLEQDLRQAKADDQALRPILTTLQQPDTLIYSLSGSNLAEAASGSLVVGEAETVTILVKNLPELPEGQVYRLWADLPTQTSLTYCGQFNSNTDGIIQLTPSSGLCGKTPRQMLITVDAATDPTTRGGPVVMKGEI
ncbi:MAG: anti-sigma factor [Elainellaceae cyanobacterium]